MNKYDLPTWEYLAKEMIWNQLDMFEGLSVLDFGSGNGATADYYAENNTVIAVEPSEEMLQDRICVNNYTQIIGGIDKLYTMQNEMFDVIICHNVLEYAAEREEIIKEFYRLLKTGGILSIVKHNRPGRVMQMAVLLNDFIHANSLLNGDKGNTEKFGSINYYDDSELIKWCPKFKVKETYGIRTFWDLQQNQEIQKNPEWQRSMLEIETRVSNIDEYKAIAFFHHLILKKQ